MPVSPSTHPTPYPDVNAILGLLLAEVRAALGDRFVGMYLYGSLSSGDFDPGSSDVDFLVATEGELPDEALAALEAMHARIAASGLPWVTRLEGSYIPRAALRRYDASDARHPSIGTDWAFGVGHHDSSWVIQRHLVRESGVVVAGPPPRTLIDPVSPDELRAAVLGTLRGYWARQLRAPEQLRARHYQAFAILTMCRALYTLERGEVVSKPVAAAWAREALGAHWAPLIERALAWRPDHRPGDVAETLRFIRYTIERADRDLPRPQPLADDAGG